LALVVGMRPFSPFSRTFSLFYCHETMTDVKFKP
jgi:hypothetical protein